MNPLDISCPNYIINCPLHFIELDLNGFLMVFRQYYQRRSEKTIRVRSPDHEFSKKAMKSLVGHFATFLAEVLLKHFVGASVLYAEKFEILSRLSLMRCKSA